MLCRTLGHKTLADYHDAMTSAERCLWQAEYELQPWGDPLLEAMLNLLRMEVRAIFADRPVRYKDVAIDWDKPPQSNEQKAKLHNARKQLAEIRREVGRLKRNRDHASG